MSSNSGLPQLSEPFTLEFCTIGGPQLGEGVNEIHSCLTIKGRSAVSEKHRSQSDRPGEPIGIFKGELTDEDLKRVVELVSSENLAGLPPPTRGGPGASLLTLKFEQGKNKIDKTLTSLDIDLIDKVDGLLSQLNRIAAMLNEHPVQAVRASLTYINTPFDEHFTLTITNIGTEQVCLLNPGYLGQGDVDAWAGVRFAEYPPERPGVTAPPLKWSRLGLERPAQRAGTGTQIILPPGAKFEARTEAWKGFRKGVRHLIQGIVSNYSGPKEVEGCYRIRGAIFSDALEITP